MSMADGRGMEQDEEVESQLLVEIYWSKLQPSIHGLFRVSRELEDCIAPGVVNELHVMSELIANDKSPEQLHGLSNLLHDALCKSTRPQKYTKFIQIVRTRSQHGKHVRLASDSQGQAFIQYLSKYYVSKAAVGKAVSFDSLAIDGVVSSLLTTDSLTMASMTPFLEADTNKDIALLAGLATDKPNDWPARLMVAMAQAGMTTELELLLPGFQQLCLENFSRSLSDICAQRSGCREVGEALDLFVCLNCTGNLTAGDEPMEKKSRQDLERSADSKLLLQQEQQEQQQQQLRAQVLLERELQQKQSELQQLQSKQTEAQKLQQQKQQELQQLQLEQKQKELELQQLQQQQQRKQLELQELGRQQQQDLQLLREKQKELECLQQQQQKQKEIELQQQQLQKQREIELQQQQLQKQQQSSPDRQPVSVDDADDAADQEAGRQQMRAYQMELAADALAGRNSVIIAPTGSGKTLVAVHIAAARLAEDPDARVCFLADRKHLVEQQHAAFREQLPARFSSRIICITGGESSDRAPLSYYLREHSVLIVSTQILLNSLKDTGVDGLNGDVGRFSLMVFDECHHCAKEHPSNKIMEIYFQFRDSNPGRRPPQIVGLTASPGTGQAQRTPDAVQHILRLCASLDCRRLVTVRRCLDSLGHHVTNPSVRIRHTGRKASDVIQECLERLMDCAEAGIRPVWPSRPPQRSSFLYTNFCGELRAKAFRICGAGDPGDAVMATAGWRYLHHCNVALLLRSLFRSVDAMRYVEGSLADGSVLDKPPTCDLDSQLRQLLTSQLPRMRQFCATESTQANCSPALEALRDILVEQFSREPDSRVLVFVQQRCFTLPVRDFLENCAPELAAVGARTGVMTGTNASGDSGGTTQTDQSGLLAAFRRGTVKILISTSVTEEGVDVQKCNAVVRFCHVTNEIAMVQSRGRGRAEGSAYHVIVPQEMVWLDAKERTNQARDAMMASAVTQLGEMTPQEFEQQVLALQREQLQEARAKREHRAAAASALAGASFRLRCSHCPAQLTSSGHLRLAQGCHRFALDPELLSSRLEARSDNSGKMFADYEVLGVALLCKQCGHRVGALCKFKELPFVEIGIQSVVFEDCATGATHGPLKKWKMVAKFLTEVALTDADLLSWAARVPEIPENLQPLEVTELE